MGRPERPILSVGDIVGGSRLKVQSIPIESA
jgi:hypothetical protein